MITLPVEILERAKTAAKTRGTTLRKFVVAAVIHEIGPATARRKNNRAKFPVFASSSPGTLKLTSRDIACFEEEEDIRRHGVAS